MALITNLLAYYKLDGNSNDSVGSLNGTDTSMSYVAGKIGSAGSFNGTTGKVEYSQTGFNLGSAFTFNVWVNAASYATRQILFIKSDGVSNATGSFSFEVGNSVNKATLTVFVGASNSTLSSSTNLTTSVWSMLTFTYDGTNLAIYLNGTSDGTNATGTGAVNTITQPTTLGMLGALSVLPYSGLMDLAGVWTRVLSGSEITQLYNGGAGLDYPFTITNNSGFFNFM